MPWIACSSWRDSRCGRRKSSGVTATGGASRPPTDTSPALIARSSASTSPWLRTRSPSDMASNSQRPHSLHHPLSPSLDDSLPRFRLPEIPQPPLHVLRVALERLALRLQTLAFRLQPPLLRLRLGRPTVQ